MTKDRIKSLRFDVLSYALSFLFHLLLSVRLGELSWRGVLPRETVFLSVGLLLMAIDQLVTSFWLHRFSIAPNAIFCALGDTFLSIFCVVSLKASLALSYLLAAVMVFVTLISFRSAILLDVYHRLIALFASVLFVSLYSMVAQQPLYLALPVSVLLYAFVLPFQNLGRREEGIFVLASALIDVLSSVGLAG